MSSTAPLRLIVDTAALAANYRHLAASSGVTCGAAVKADAYGLGAHGTVRALARAGCRDFFVANWDEAAALGELGDDVRVGELDLLGHSVIGAE